MKTCKACQTLKTLDQFYKSKDHSLGVHALCKSCHLEQSRWNARKRKYGIGKAEYQVLLQAQSGVCAICSAPEENTSWGTFHIDHDHLTNKIRGLLCDACNKALGGFQDQISILQKAITYLGNACLQKDNNE